MWQATQGMLDALLLAGLFILPMGLVALGVAMLGTPAFGRGLGRASVALGAVGVTAATTSVVLLDDVSGVAVVGALIAFHLLLGWKAHRLSMAPRSTSLTAR